MRVRDGDRERWGEAKCANVLISANAANAADTVYMNCKTAELQNFIFSHSLQ